MNRAHRLNIVVIISLGIIAMEYVGSALAAPSVRAPVRNSRPAVGTAARKSQPALDNFAKARVYFSSGQYEKAIQFASADLRTNPTRKISVMIMAQSYYRLGQAGKAAKLFSLLSPDELSSEAALDYTLAMFATRRYRQATKAWQRVSADHPYRDVARFYAGISYMQLNLYNKASQLLRGALKLPSHLKSERRRLIAEVDELLERQRRGEFTAGQAYAYQQQQNYYQVPPPVEAPPLPGAPPIPKKPAAPVVAPKAGFSFSATPSFSYITKSVKRDFNGYEQVQASSRSPVATVPLQMKYLGKSRSFGGQPALTLNVTPGYEDVEGTLAKSSLTAPASDPSAVQAVSENKESHIFSSSLLGGVDVMFPVSEPVDIGVGYKEDRFYPSAGTKLEKVVSGPNASLVIDGDEFKAELGWSMYESRIRGPKFQTISTSSATLTRNGESSVTKLKGTYIETDAKSKSGEQTRISADLNWDKTWDDFTLGLLAGYVTKTAYTETVIADSRKSTVVMDAARNLTSAGGSLKWTMSFGLAVTGSYKRTQFSDYESLKEDPTTKEPLIVSSTGTLSAFGLSGGVSIGPYVSAEAAYNYTERKLVVGDPAYETAILTDACSQLSETSVKLGVRYPF